MPIATINKLKSAICTYMNRSEAEFARQGDNVLFRAINNAKNFAQRAIDFELARANAKLASVSLTNGGSLANAVREGTSDLIKIKSIKYAYFGTTQPTVRIPVTIFSKQDYERRIQRNGYLSASTIATGGSRYCSTDFALVQYSNLVKIVQTQGSQFSNESADLYFDVMEWLPDFGTSFTGTSAGVGYEINKLKDASVNFVTLGVNIGDVVVTENGTALVTAVTPTVLTLNGDISEDAQFYTITTGEQESFLLDYCFDYMQFRSIFELNFFLKEDQRVEISSAMLEQIWNNVVQWNATYINNSIDVSLD